MRRVGVMVSLLLFAWVPSAALLAEETAAEKGWRLAKAADAANEGFVGETGRLELLIIDPQGRQTQRRMLSKVKEVLGDGDKIIITFEWPADVKGAQLLTWSHRTVEDDQWLYLPIFKRTRRVNAAAKTGSFMGSEFSFEDLGSFEFEKYRWTFLREEMLDARKVSVLQAIPTDWLSMYAKLLIYLDPEYMNPLKIEYFDRKDNFLKTATYLDYKKFGKFWRAARIDMLSFETKKRSMLIWQDRKLGSKFTDTEFNKEELED